MEKKISEVINDKTKIKEIQWIAWFFEIKTKKGTRWCSCCKKVEEIMAIK